MKIFYFGYDPCDIALIASYIHLNKFSFHWIPTMEEVISIYRAQKIKPDAQGIPLYIGNDEYHNEIYAVGFGKNSMFALQAIAYLNPGETGWKFYSTLQERNVFLKLGSFFLNRLKLIDLGMKLSALGARKSYLRLVKLVEKIKGLNRVG